MKRQFSELEKNQLLIFFVISYAIPLLMGIVMGLGFGKDCNISLLPGAQMLCPAIGVMAAILLTKRANSLVPQAFFCGNLVLSFCLVLYSFFAVFLPPDSSELIFNASACIVGVILLPIILSTDRQKKLAYGLLWSNTRSSVLCVGSFVVLFCLIRVVLSLFEAPTVWGRVQQIPVTALTSLPALCVSFFLSWLPFFGEEYGWRYFLQPLLQKRFGKRAGVLLLGVLWGIWHIHLDLFYYSSFDVLAIFAQQVTCIFLGIFFAYAYMRTNNIWVPTALHFLNNNLSFVLRSQETAESAALTWGDLLLWLGVNAVIFGGFLFTNDSKKADTTNES